MQKLPIPQTDWTEDDGYVLMLLCCPDDPVWIGTVRGRVYELSIGRTWNEDTGIVTEVQKVGREIWESMATCRLEDLVTAVTTLNVTFLAQQQLMSDIVTALGQIKTAVEASGANEDLEDDLANVWGTLQAINTVLGGSNPSPPDPL